MKIVGRLSHKPAIADGKDGPGLMLKVVQRAQSWFDSQWLIIIRWYIPRWCYTTQSQRPHRNQGEKGFILDEERAGPLIFSRYVNSNNNLIIIPLPYSWRCQQLMGLHKRNLSINYSIYGWLVLIFVQDMPKLSTNSRLNSPPSFMTTLLPKCLRADDATRYAVMTMTDLMMTLYQN